MRREAQKVIKEAGHCQACMRVQMVREIRPGLYWLVQHGYRRPGDGRIVGGCMGVDHPPFEISKDLITKIRDGLIRFVEDYTAFLDRLTTGKTREFMVEDRDKPVYSEQKDRWGKPKILGYKKKWISLDSKDISEKIAAEHKRDSIIRQVSQELRLTITEVEERTKMIEQWKLRPILEWDAYEQEKKRRGAPKDVPAEVGALLLKMARKSKSTVSFPVLKQALELLDGLPCRR